MTAGKFAGLMVICVGVAIALTVLVINAAVRLLMPVMIWIDK